MTIQNDKAARQAKEQVAGKKIPALPKDLGRLKVKRMTGAERLHNAGADCGVDLKTFWQWSVSDLVSNLTRGRFAEFIVARALGIPTDGVRDEWAAFDLTTPDGLKVEVKSAAFVQSWYQACLSPISFHTSATHAYNPANNVLSLEAKWQADVYVLALLAHTDKATIDPLDVGQWRFYVLPASVLKGRKRNQHSITLPTLEKEYGPSFSFCDLDGAVKEAGVVNALAHVAEVLRAAGKPMGVKAILVATKGLGNWNALHGVIMRDIKANGEKSQFVRLEGGKIKLRNKVQDDREEVKKKLMEFPSELMEFIPL